jgi:hypothetical protein
VGFVGKGRIVTEERVELCGVRVTWYVVLFMDDVVGRERAAGSSIDLSYANAIKVRWERETCAVFGDAPVKYATTGPRAGARTCKKPVGHDPKATKKKISNTDSVTSSN